MAPRFSRFQGGGARRQNGRGNTVILSTFDAVKDSFPNPEKTTKTSKPNHSRTLKNRKYHHSDQINKHQQTTLQLILIEMNQIHHSPLHAVQILKRLYHYHKNLSTFNPEAQNNSFPPCGVSSGRKRRSGCELPSAESRSRGG